MRFLNRPPAPAPSDYPDAVLRVEDDSGDIYFVSVSIGDDGTWSQWGAPREVLSRSVHLCEALAAANAEGRQ